MTPETPSPLREAVEAARCAFDTPLRFEQVVDLLTGEVKKDAPDNTVAALLAWYRALPITDAHVEVVARAIRDAGGCCHGEPSLAECTYMKIDGNCDCARLASVALQASRDHFIRELEML